MFKNFFKNHQYKIILGAPIIFLVIINSSSMIGDGNIFFFTNSSSGFITVGDEAEITLSLRTASPINAVGATVTITPDVLEMASLSRISSVIDLWSEEPSYDKEKNSLHFSGGVLGEKSEAPLNGEVFRIHLRALAPGIATVAMKDGELLASNGEGTNIISGSNVLKLYIRSTGSPSPDINQDNTLSISDVNLLYLKTFRTYDARYDLNTDGRVSFADVRMLLNLF
jgi:hypothetical protein